MLRAARGAIRRPGTRTDFDLPAKPTRMEGMSDEQTTAPQNEQPDREWIPVPPPNPYAAGGFGAAGGGGAGTGAPGAGRGLAIAAMAIGLVALLTAAVSAFYFSVFVVLAALLGIVAAVLGIVALVKRRLRPAAITGLVAGALAVCIAIGVGGLALGALLNQSVQSPSEASGSGSASDEGEQWDPEQQQEALIEWPANMGTGGILFAAGPDGPEPVPSAPVAAGEAPEAPPVSRGEGPADILLHVDYRCPHCVDFEAANAQVLEELVSEGRATLEIRPLAFVQPFSTQLSGAMACMVDAQPEAAWAAHLALLSPETQQIGDTAGLVAALDEASDGLNAEARSCVEADRFGVFASALSDWYTSTPVPNAVDPQLRVRGTPLAVVNGVAYAGAPDDHAAFLAFLAEQGL
ncbi:MAG: hypothetical protein D3X82_03785 [Candidatus Leucobacter sulfamidivorax]|nr:hypothetical protein [Candidatus Leucobacter sulfamidivorax]